jgi:MazG family protein
MESRQKAGEGFVRLLEIMARLRGPGGCPWDREQTFDTIKPYLLEETYEVMQTIDERDWKELSEELGDLLLQVVFFSQMAHEAGHFEIGDAIEAINSKLIRRHPHVFGDGDAKTAGEVLKKWDEIKAAENKAKEKPKGLLANIPKTLPALVEGEHLARKAAGAGFDWPNVDEVFDKLREELDELDDARKNGTPEEVEGEIGDLLFVVVNIARFLKVDPEQALRKTNAKFRRRFEHVEAGLGKPLQEASLDEMESLWQEAKRQGK